MPALIIASASWALFVAFTGGVDAHAVGLRIKSTSPDRPVYATAILAALYLHFYRDDARRRTQSLVRLTPAIGRLERVVRPIVGLLSLTVCVVGIRQGVLVADASDAWGYVSQADLWLAGNLIVEQPVALEVPWPNADWTFAPLGYRPATHRGAIVPTYPPGLPVLMAAGKSVLGACGPFMIVPILGGLTIWFTYLLGVRVSSPLAGLAAAALVASSPIFLLMVLTPFSDVPATAFLVLGLVLALSSLRWRAFATGAAVSMAVFIRPNLVFVGAVFMMFIALNARPAARESVFRARWRAVVWFSLGGAPLVLAVAALNTILYGSPFSAGHGNLAELYSWKFIWRNLIDYPRWLWTTESPFIMLALIPMIATTRLRERRLAIRFLGWFVAVVCLSYLLYRAYGLWLYLRFLLPVIPVLIVLMVSGAALLLGRVNDAGQRRALTGLMIVGVLSLRVGVIRGEEILERWREGVPYTSVGAYVRQHLPANAVILTVQHSGSLRYYADRLTLRWDFLAPEWWPRALDVLRERGYRPYVLLTNEENDAFRSRFGLSGEVEAPGTLLATFVGQEVNRLYDPMRSTPLERASIPVVRAAPCACRQSASGRREVDHQNR